MASEQDNTSQGQVEHKVSFISNRGLRQIPLNWEHPRDERGSYIPLQDRELAYTEEEIEEGLADGWLKSRQEAEDMLMPDFSNVPQEQMGICAYETTSEGTP